MCKHVCVCLHVCTCVCECICVYAYICICICASMYIIVRCVWICVYVCICVFICVYVCDGHVRIYMYVYISVCYYVGVYMCVCTYMYMHMHVCMSVCTLLAYYICIFLIFLKSVFEKLFHQRRVFSNMAKNLWVILTLFRFQSCSWCFLIKSAVRKLGFLPFTLSSLFHSYTFQYARKLVS